jgi:DNA polymerase-3 subunit alpha
MAFGALEDLTGAINLVIFPDAFAKAEPILRDDEPLIFEGVLEREEDSQQLIVEKVFPLRDKTSQVKRLKFQLEMDLIEKMQELKAVMERHPGEASVKFEVDLVSLGKTVQLDIVDQGIKPTKEFFDDLQSKFGRTSFVQIEAN